MTGRRSAIQVGLVLGVILVFVSCATFSNVKPWAERTPKEKALSFLQMYNRQFDDTMRLASTPNITESQKEIVRTKKKLLTEMRTPLDIYSMAVIEGRIPSADLESKLILLVDKLLAAGG